MSVNEKASDMLQWARDFQGGGIPDLVEDIIGLGCDICAIGRTGYVIGDADLPRDIYDRVAPELQRIQQFYGSRDHLLPQIVAHLHSIARVYVRDPITTH